MPSARKITIDFETRSQVSLFDVGAYAYSVHPTTDVLCLGWSGEDQWRMGDKPPRALFKLIQNSDVVEAYNAFFEMCIWENICHARYGWPAVPSDKWRCTAAKAAAHALPRALLDAGRALELDVVKDELHGSWAMKKLSRPRKPTKNDKSIWNNDPGDWELMLAYNRNDVAAEEELSAALADLSPRELALWRLTERMNLRGIPVDAAGARKAVQLAGEHARRLTEKFQKLTGLESAGQRAKFLLWLHDNDAMVEDTQAATLDALMKNGCHPHVKEAVQIVREIGRSSIAKYRAITEIEVGGRVRGGFLYCGAAATGRWAGRGIQPHNFPRVVLDQERHWDFIHDCDSDTYALMGDPLKMLSDSLRGVICAPDGREFLAGDFAQIEPRKLFWLAGERGGLDAFRRGEDVYCDAASMIFNRTITKADEDERFLGKHAILALGFGAGFVKYLVHCRDLGAPRFTFERVKELVPPGIREALWAWISTDGLDMVKRLIPEPTREDLIELVLTKYIVDRYRQKYKDTVVKLWAEMERCAKAAMSRPGVGFQPNWNMTYFREGWFLKLKLPSGRCLHYPDPEINSHGELTYMRQNMQQQWVREKTYGGKLTENAVQASARDIMADAMLRLEGAPPYNELVMTVHDDVLAEVDRGAGSLDEFRSIMEEVPPWAKGLPIKVDAWRGKRYRK